MLKIICINGAPGVGKDTAGKLLRVIHGRHGVQIMKFAQPIDDIAMRILQIDSVRYKELREKGKESIPWEHGCKVTFRQLMINISEELIKPTMGKYWFAEVLANKIAKTIDDNQLVVITDSGFQYEFDRFKESLEGVADIKLIHMTRSGYTFDNDSRHKVTNGEDTIYLNNDGSIDDLRQLLDTGLFT